MKPYYTSFNLRFVRQAKSIIFFVIIQMIALSGKAQPDVLEIGKTNLDAFTAYQTYKDYLIPNNVSQLTITVVGGSGEGMENATFSCQPRGGRGAQITASFFVGDYTCPTGNFALKPGGTLRFIVGLGGSTVQTNQETSSAGAGGGGSAALYQEPGSTNWTILLVAGGGGGAALFSCHNEGDGYEGKDAELGESGSAGGGPFPGAGGSNGNGGKAGGSVGIEGDGGGGGGAFSGGADGLRDGIGGSKGGTTGGIGGVYHYEDPSTSYDVEGGFGFGAGGAGAIAGGGGGGYSGGGGGSWEFLVLGAKYHEGGGGGSYVVKGAFNVSKNWNTATTGFGQRSINGSAEINAIGGSNAFSVKRLFVNEQASGKKDGSSWVNAFTNLHDAIEAANFYCSAEIWVAKGVYYPDEGEGENDNDRNSTFSLRSGVALYGGFAGVETDLSQRNWFTNKTYLSGDIDQNDLLSNEGADYTLNNSYHVVVADRGADNIDGTAIVDGFIITSGNADAATGTNAYGGGLFCRNASPTVTNCEFRSNQALYGGAIANYDQASAFVSNCFFKGNVANVAGGAIYFSNSSPYLYNSVFSGNFALPINGVGGGAVYITNSSPEFINCSFSGNNAANGGAIYNTQKSLIKLFNTIIWNNLAGQQIDVPSASVFNSGGAVTEYYSSLVHNLNLSGSNGNLDGTAASNNPLFTTAVDAFTAPTTEGNLLQAENSPVIDKGNNGYTGFVTDILGNPRLVNDIIDMGAFERALCTPSQWIVDNDHDGYYSGEPVESCTSPGAEYIIRTNQQPGDCDDANAAINPATVWYKDADNDLYSDGTTVTQCTRPANYKLASELIATSGDCDDGNAAINPATKWYKDADNDLYSDGTTVTQCTRPANYKLASELTATNGDCNDGDATLNPATIWYYDGDGDGYNNTLYITQPSCTSPGPGYITTTKGPDCNDANSAINPATIWYKDADNDLYSDGTTATQCTRPANYKLASELTATNGDCDDGNAAINPATKWYKDADNDGYSDGTTATQCTRPINYKRASELTATSGDCDDGNAAINPATKWYKDADNDGYSDGTNLTQCVRPANYKLASELTATNGDCNDADATINPTTKWYRDADNDGYSDGAILTQCARPANYKLTSELTATSGDCNDGNAAINPATKWYKDADNDGYSDGTNLTQCARPANYKLVSELTATNGDCNDADATINPATKWYKDADNDGYSDGSILSQCARPSKYKLASELTATSGDCNDNDGTVHSPQTYYRDADGDGYGTASKTTSVCSSIPPPGYVANNADCNDGDPAISPAAVEVCGNKVDDNCNGVVDENVCYPCQNGTNFTATNISSTSAQLNWVAMANPTQWDLQYKTTKPGSTWVDVLLTGNVRTVNLTGLGANQTYNWHIRAKCGKNWTDYSVAATFKTLANGTLNTIAMTGKTTSETIDHLQVQAMPNPTNTNFNLMIKGTNQSAEIKMLVVDMYGRIIEQRILHYEQTIILGDKYRPGTYIVKFIQGEQNREVKLIKLPH